MSLVVVLWGADVAAAQSANGQGTDFFVTVAARSCPTYEDITANLARDDIQESLRDLGPETPYTSGEPINPVKEDAHQTACCRSPTGGSPWARASAARSRACGARSPYSTDVVTKAHTPTLDEQGRPASGTIAGATTFELTGDQKDQASHNGFWIQGGTVSDPVLDQVYPGTYGFGALRRAVDNLNGDNVETVHFPSGSRHVFCYAYYVIPPPASGTIVIRRSSSARRTRASRS